MIVGLPKADMPQYLFDDIFFLDKTDDAHRCWAFSYSYCSSKISVTI